MALLLPLALSGCTRHKPVAVVPVDAGPPPHPTSITTYSTMPPALPPPGKPAVSLATAEPSLTPPPAPRTRKVLRKKRLPDAAPTPPPVATASAAPAQNSETPLPAAPNTPSLGTLSAGNEADSRAISSMLDQIRALEARLAGIKQPPSNSGEEDTTATQVRLFLAKARQATLANDLDGAHTLAVKAKVLLDELSNQ